MVRNDNGKSKQLLSREDRLEHENVREMHAARIRIIQNDDVARKQIAPEAIQNNVHCIRHCAEMQRHGLGLRENATLAIADRHRIVENIADNWRAGGPHDGVCHVIDDCIEARFDNSERDWIDACVHVRQPLRLTTSPPARFGSMDAPGGTTMVVSALSIMAGPSKVPITLLRETTGTSFQVRLK